MRLEKLNAYADDIPFIEEFNKRTKNPDHQLHTEILPYPFIGDVLGARVVLLMSNPGYKVSSNIEAHEKMSDEEKRMRADFVIVNDGETPLIPQVLELISLLSKNNHYLCSAKK